MVQQIAKPVALYVGNARLHFVIGNLDAAIKAQSQAVTLSDGSDQGSFQEFLAELQAEATKVKK